MKVGPILAVLVVAGYIGFEMFAVSRNSYRMEPEHIFGQFVGAAHAVSRCGAPDDAQFDTFQRNRASARARARSALAKADPAAVPAALDAELTDLITAAEADVDATIADLGCDDIELWRWQRRFENLARLNLPSAKPTPNSTD